MPQSSTGWPRSRGPEFTFGAPMARDYYTNDTQRTEVLEFEPTDDPSVVQFMGEGEREDLLKAFIERTKNDRRERA